MKNEELAKIFYEIAEMLEMKDVEWKPVAYKKAAQSIESLGRDIEEIYKNEGIKGLEEIPGVGEGIAKKIVEFINTGKVKEHERLKKELPEGLLEILEVPGLGVKKAKVLYKKLGIKSIKDLEEAARKHKIRLLPTFKQKTEENILKGIEFLKKSGKEERKLLGIVLPIAERIRDELKNLKEVEKVDIAGSIRRMKETVRDIDILVITSNPLKVIEYFSSMKGVKRVLTKGETRASVIIEEGLQVDLRVIGKECYGSALLYFTGNKEHSIHLRRIALKKGLKINEYGLFKIKKKNEKEERIAGKEEKEMYEKLGMKYIEPELREDRGEIEAALAGKLPKLVKYEEIKGDLHTHTEWSDGSESLEEMAKNAEALGYEYIAITDHAGNLKIAHSLDEKRIEKQIKEIDELNKKSKVRILKGAEVDILADGSLSLPNRILKKLDIVTASIHSGFKFSMKKNTERILKAMENEYVRVIGHPTGRIIYKREPCALELEEIFEKARETKTALEINAFPNRLDLNDTNVRDALEKKVKLAIGTDAHTKDHLRFLKLGIGVARRGWASPSNILNTYDLKKLERWLKNR